jgi:hypothetical protein
LKGSGNISDSRKTGDPERETGNGENKK